MVSLLFEIYTKRSGMLTVGILIFVVICDCIRKIADLPSVMTWALGRSSQSLRETLRPRADRDKILVFRNADGTSRAVIVRKLGSGKDANVSKE